MDGSIYSLYRFFFALLMAIFILISRFNYKYYFSHDEIRKQFKIGKSIFIARIASGLYKNFNVLILGYCATPSAVGVYSIAEKYFVVCKWFKMS
nr:oligosaccharide flippase family protein [Klebsiella variicola]